MRLECTCSLCAGSVGATYTCLLHLVRAHCVHLVCLLRATHLVRCAYPIVCLVCSEHTIRTLCASVHLLRFDVPRRLVWLHGRARTCLMWARTLRVRGVHARTSRPVGAGELRAHH